MGGTLVHLIYICMCPVSLGLSGNFVNLKDLPAINQDNVDYPEAAHMNVTHKMGMAYREVKLHCLSTTTTTNNKEPQNTRNVTWFFKPCGPGLNKVRCESILRGGWDGEPVCGQTNQKPCRPTLTIPKPIGTSSGLYRCYQMEGREGFVIRATILNTFELEIVERNTKEPEFLEPPRDLKAPLSSMAVFSCRVHSSLPLRIRWLKELGDNETNNSNTITYSGKKYELLPTAGVMKNQDDVYYSKFSFGKVTLKDSGVYVCGALNEAGIQYKEAKLTVVPLELEKPKVLNEPKETEETSKNKWEIFASVMVFVAIVLLACCWPMGFFIYGIFQRAAKMEISANETNQTTRQTMHLSTIGSETSEYEHIITL